MYEMNIALNKYNNLFSGRCLDCKHSLSLKLWIFSLHRTFWWLVKVLYSKLGSRHSSYTSHASRMSYTSHADLLVGFGGNGKQPMTKEFQLMHRSMRNGPAMNSNNIMEFSRKPKMGDYVSRLMVFLRTLMISCFHAILVRRMDQLVN